MKELLATIQFLLIIYLLIYEYNKKSIGVFLWATVFLMFGVMHFLDVVIGISDYNVEVMNTASIFVMGFCSIYLLFRYVLTQKYKMGAIQITELNCKRKDEITIIGMLIFAFLIFVYYIYNRFGGFSNTTWNLLLAENYNSTIYNSHDILYIFYYYVSDIITAFFGIFIVYFFQRRYVALGLVTGGIIVYVILSRTRSDLMPFICCIIVILMLKFPRITWKLVLVTTILIIIVIYLIYGLQIIRVSGSFFQFLKEFSFNDFNNEIISLLSQKDGELNLRDAFYYFISKKNEFPGFEQMESYKGLLLLPIPSGLTLGLKPQDFAITMGMAYTGNYANTNFSMHPTLFGDCYANLGIFGVCLGGFWAIFVTFIDRKILKTKWAVDKLLYITIWAVTFILIGRGSVYYSCRSGLVATILVFVIRHFWLNVKIKV